MSEGMKIATPADGFFNGEVLDLERARRMNHMNPGFIGTHEAFDIVLDALEAALSVPKRPYERDDEKAVTAYNFAIADVWHAAGKIEEKPVAD